MSELNNRLLDLPNDMDNLELMALKNKRDITLNKNLETIKNVLSSNPTPEEIKIAKDFIDNLKMLKSKYKTGIYANQERISADFENLSDEFKLYSEIKLGLDNLKKETKSNPNNTSPAGLTFIKGKPLNSEEDLNDKKGKKTSKLSEEMQASEITGVRQETKFHDGRGSASGEIKYSSNSGELVSGTLSHMVGNQAAVSVNVEAGSKEARFLGSLGYQIDSSNSVMVTFEHYQKMMDFMFTSGEVSERMSQNSVGATYKLKLNHDFVKSLELNGYVSKSDSKQLENKDYVVDTATMYELFRNYRNIAGGQKIGGSFSLGLVPWKDGTLKLTANYENVKFDTQYEGDKYDKSRIGGGVTLTQKLSDKYSVEAGVGTSSTENIVANAKLKYDLEKNIQLFIGGTHISRKGGIGGSQSSENIVSAGISGTWATSDDMAKIEESARQFEESKANRKPRPYMPALDMSRAEDAPLPITNEIKQQYNELLDWVARNPAVRSHTILAVVDQYTNRLIAIDKTALPAGANIDKPTGNILVDLVPVIGINNTKLNGAAYAGAGFSILGGKLLINTLSLTPPASGTDTYVVTIDEVGGGQTLVTVQVEKGSVKIKSISIERIAGAPDTTPDAFTLVDQTNVALGTVITSAPITVAGINSPSPITVAGATGEYSINGGAWTSAAGTVTNGQTVRVRNTSSNLNSTAVNTTLTIGGVSDIFTITTLAAGPDTTPDAFTFSDQTNVALSTLTESAAITVSGINAASAISISAGGEYSINGGAWTAVAGTVTNGQTVKVRNTSSASNSTAVNTTLTIGGVSDIFTITTLAAPGNVAPEAINSTYLTDIGNAAKTFDWKVLLTATDVDGDTLTATVQTNGTKGVFAIAGDNITYTPNASQTGSDICTIRISDGQGHTIDRTITVTNIDTLAPAILTGGPTLAAVGGVYYSKLTTSNVTVTAAGTNGGGRVWLNGADTGVDITDGNSRNYDANLASEGNNSFSYTIKDGAGNESTPLAFNVFRDTVAPGNLSWVTAQPTLKNTLYSCEVGVDETGSGINPTGLSVTTDSGGVISNISVSGNHVLFNYTSNGPGDTITISGTDKAGNAFTKTIDTAVLSDPVDITKPATPTLTLASGAAYTNTTNIDAIVTNDTDNVGVTGWYISESSSTPAAGSFTAEPTTFALSAGDGAKTVYVWTRDAAGNISDPATDTITLDTTPPGALSWISPQPTLKNTLYSCEVGVDETGSGINPTGLSVTADNGGVISNISVSGNHVLFNYTSNGPGDTITISGTDKAGNAFTKTIDTALLNSVPVANDVTRDVAFAAPSITYDLAPDISDVETPDAGLTIVVVTPPAHTSLGGSFVWNTNTQFTITADIGYAGDDFFTYKVVDANGGESAVKTVTIQNLNG
ncbi:Ig-like domain-containing protein [Candidatus Gracilibacteria bacterium]|nr:Ig-like domain-containing protein [Candidatus Gracilibacteria bacterium]